MRAIYAFLILLGLSACSVELAAAATRETPKRGRTAVRPPLLVPAHGAQGLGWKVGTRYASPDGKYAAIVSYYLPVPYVHVVARGSNRPIASVGSTTGFQWLPNDPHRLVVSTSFVYGRGNLLEWTGGARWKHLVKQRNVMTDDFGLVGFRPSSGEIVYTHARCRSNGREVFRRTRTLRSAPLAKH